MYEIDDHFALPAAVPKGFGRRRGNVRAVIGSTYTDTYTATMESENATVEDGQFVNIAPRVNAGMIPPPDSNNEAVQLSSSRPMGPGIALTVAPGDVITAQVDAYYEGGSGYSNTLPVATIVNAVATVFGGISGGPLGDPGTAIFDAFDDAYSGGFAGGAGSSDDAVPAAWLNLVMFSGSMDTDPLTLPMSAIQVSSAANLARETLTIGPIDIPAPGYVYIYVNCNSNTTNTVTFDNLEVTHLHAPFVAGGDYYPFGLPIANRQIDVEPYRWGYQGQFAEEDSVTGWNQFELRMYDAGFGRWLSPDPYGQFASPYVGMGNVPTIGLDPSGGFCDECLQAFIDAGGTVLDEVTVTASRIATASLFGGLALEGFQIAGGLINNGIGSWQPQTQLNLAPIAYTPRYQDPNALIDDFKPEINFSIDGVRKVRPIVEYSQSASKSILAGLQLGAIAYRRSLALEAKIGTFSRFRSAYQAIGIGRNIVGAPLVGYLGVGLDAYLNFHDASLPEGNPNKISFARASYRTTGDLAALGASAVIGAEIGGVAGGAVGAAAGVLVSGAFWAGEKSYDGIIWFGHQLGEGLGSIEYNLRHLAR